MSGLPWVRIDADFYAHPKFVKLLKRKDGHRSAFVFVCAVGYAGRFGTDGLILPETLEVIRARPLDVQNLVAENLWDVMADGWLIHDYSDYQQTSDVTDEVRLQKRRAGLQGACAKHHEPGCQCWKAKL